MYRWHLRLRHGLRRGQLRILLQLELLLDQRTFQRLILQGRQRGSVACDSRGVAWRFGADDVAYFDNGWHAVGVVLPANRTGPVDVYQRTLLIGTASGVASFEDVIPAA